jgi:calcineurin-like phosphoesterase family protein
MEKVKRWILSDPHFGHKMLVETGMRPFSTVEEHDETIINNINELVHRDDKLWILGDFALTSNQKN